MDKKKKLNITYWAVTGTFAAYIIIITSLPSVMMDKQSVALISEQLGYPEYFIPFTGIAKILGCIVILIPGYPKIKEWAYAGLCFDLVAATYSIVAVFGLDITIIIMLLHFVVLFWSYYLSTKKYPLVPANK